MDKKIVFGIIALAVLAIAFGGGLPNFSTTGTTGIGLILSVGNVNLQSSDPVLNGDVIAINFLANQQWNSTLQALSQDQVLSKLTGKDVTHNFTFSVGQLNQKIEFPITADARSVPLQYSTEKLIGSYSDDAKIISDCQAKGSQGSGLLVRAYSNATFGFFRDGYCVFKKQTRINSFGTIQPANNILSLPATLNIDGVLNQTVTITNSTTNPTVTQKFGNAAYLALNGFLISPVVSTTPNYSQQALVRGVYIDGHWDVVTDTAVDEYTTLVNQSGFGSSSTVGSLAEYNNANLRVQFLQQSFNALIDLANSSPPTLVVGSKTLQPIVSTTTTSLGKVVVDVQDQYTLVPNMVLYINQSVVGLKNLSFAIAIPKFSIQPPIQSVAFITGHTGYFNVNVLNSGDSGNASGGASCDKGLTANQSGNTFIDSGKVGTIVIPINGSTAATDTSTCTITIRNVTTAHDDAIAQATIQINPIIGVCTPLSRFCSSNTEIRQWDNICVVTSLIETCSSGQTCQPDSSVGYSCQGSKVVPPTPPIPPKCDAGQHLQTTIDAGLFGNPFGLFPPKTVNTCVPDIDFTLIAIIAIAGGALIFVFRKGVKIRL